jgi:hypothetical protein
MTWLRMQQTLTGGIACCQGIDFPPAVPAAIGCTAETQEARQLRASGS